MGRNSIYYRRRPSCIESRIVLVISYVLLGNLPKFNLLNTCKALYIVSLWEGFGLPALEALACGTKVVSSNRGGLPEIVSGVGTMVDPKDINQISFSMKEIFLENKLINKFQKKGILRSKEFSWELAAEEICNLIS